MNGERFAPTLRRLRVERGLSQTGLALRAGVDPASVNRMERSGERRPDGSTLRLYLPGREILLAIAEALGLPDDETDRLLYCVGLAPATDWQLRAENAEARLRQVLDAAGRPPAASAPMPLRRQVGR